MKIYKQLENKYAALSSDAHTHLKGLLHAKELNYWEYIQLDTLLTLQKPRSIYGDEEIFIIYHQNTELTFKLMLRELKQIWDNQENELDDLLTRVSRLVRYTNMLINTFDIMKHGMDMEQYQLFRNTLAPASGLQSIQYRLIELHCTSYSNLVSGELEEFKIMSEEERLDNLYWKKAGLKSNGDTTLTMAQFELKYRDELIETLRKVKGKTLEDKIFLMQNIPGDLREMLKEFDYLYNVAWPLVHLDTAQHYLQFKSKASKSTGDSNWVEYLHPKNQKRIFFPTLWSEKEKSQWGQIHQ
ncbi:tryptophan 2,3-dioxygenase [Muricauda sp. CAU 1633]|uniref:tryptophan 2,3-dioxygenase family protein n=1 Tax=Allomuricauda sp. CAU 1633 TaxID=2816036 RepID=UPI001A8CC8A5|nr:tryptophan 2,3-dioxygenase family protein [Muricauda sp. CAU 1633]MBO0323782.1 tryptophan 2,3-dioxygenase [Muricauda sp. CAU 1633]